MKFYQAAGVHIDLFLQPGIPPIEADQNQLRQVFHNLLSNSMEAVPDKDKLVVSIRASVVTDEAGDVEGVELDVSDNGPGFTDQILEHAFEPYVTTKSSGTGLGLATIKKLLRSTARWLLLKTAKMRMEMSAAQGLSSFFTVFGTNKADRIDLVR